jgi:hypothetical protein
MVRDGARWSSAGSRVKEGLAGAIEPAAPTGVHRGHRHLNPRRTSCCDGRARCRGRGGRRYLEVASRGTGDRIAASLCV